MRFFKHTQDSDLYPDFINYLNSFKSHLIESINIEDGHLLDMVYSSGVNGENISEFLSNSNYRDSISLMYLLLRDYDLECGIRSPMTKHHDLYKVFKTAFDFFIQMGNDTSLLDQHGAAGLVNSFPVRVERIRMELASLIYEDIVENDYYDDSNGIIPDSISEYLCKSSRLMMLRQEVGRCDSNKGIPKEISALSDPLFFEKSIEEKRIIFDCFFEKVITGNKAQNLINQEEYGDDEISDDDIYKDAIDRTNELLHLWVPELIISNIIGGYDAKEAVKYGKDIVEVILDKLGFSGNEKTKKTDEILKSALLATPSCFKDVFGENKSYINHVFTAENIEEILKFNGVSGIYGISSTSINILNEYDQYSYDSISSIVNKYSFPADSINDICERHELIKAGQAQEIVSMWLDSTDKRLLKQIQEEDGDNHHDAKENAGNIYSEMMYDLSSIRHGVKAIGSDSLNEIFNGYMLKSMADYGTQNTDNIKFIFSSTSERELFIKNTLQTSKNINKDVIMAGDFTQKELSPYWEELTPSVKKAIICSDLSM